VRPSQVRRVLVADDDPDMITILRVNLEAEGYAVDAAVDGQAALDLARGTRPDMIVLDVMMPCIDGIAVLTEMRSDPDTRDIPIVLLTAKSNDDDIWAGWSAGADYYLTKPFQLDELLHFIEYLGTQAQISLP
jgi:DNA-binding response OmpR family regulator